VEAGEGAGVCKKTVWTRMQDPAFKERVSSLRAEMVSRAVGRLSEAMGEAADTLRALLTDPDAKVRLGAARSVCELAGKLRERKDLDRRIAELEGRLKERTS